MFASEEGGVGNKNPHPQLKFASEGGGWVLAGSWALGVIVVKKKKKKKKKCLY